MWKPMKVVQKWNLPSPSSRNRPVIFGNQKYRPEKVANTMVPNRT